MKVVKIEGVKEDAVIIQSYLEPFLPDYPVFILNKKRLLYDFIENLEVNGDFLYRLKIAKDIDFSNISIILKDKFSDDIIKENIKSLNDLLESLNEDIIKNSKLIVDSEDKNLISEIVQAFIYLNIDMEVMMKREDADSKIVNAFRRQFGKISTSVADAEKKILDFMVNADFSGEKERLLNLLYSIADDINKARERDLYISVMATKKAGKSVIVNSFLNEEYAPTSFELPTPNTCIYRKSKDENIRLLYGNMDIIFKSVKDAYKYIYNEFKKAQNDRERSSTIDDMEIFYTNPDTDFTSFTVIDTPGSNYALAADIKTGENLHKRNTYEWIRKSDVVIFLINYSNYLSIDEEKFLKDIKAQFEDQNKFYSLIIVVNKLDEMYISECENKSVVRFLDYIKSKLNDLGYKGFTVMGTSARSYFDAIKVSRIDNTVIGASDEYEPIDNLTGSRLRDRLKMLKKQFIGKAEMSALSFVDDQLEKLRCFYGLDDYSLNTLKEKSGIPSLMKYTKYISVRKAYLELYSPLIRSIDEQYVKLSNTGIVMELIDLKKYHEEEYTEIENRLQNLIRRLEVIELRMQDKLSFQELRTKLSTDIQKSIDQRLEYVFELCERGIDEFFTKLTLKNSEQLRGIKNRTMGIDLSVNNSIFIEELNTIIEEFFNILNQELDEKEKYIKESEARMRRIVRGLSKLIKTRYELENFNITVPKIDQEFRSRLLDIMPILNAASGIIREKVIESIEVKGSTVGKIFNHFMRNKYDYYSINSTQLKKVKEEYIYYLRKNVNNEYYACYDLLKTTLTECIDKYDAQLQEVFSNITKVYKNIITEVLKDLANTKAGMDKQLSNIDSKLQFLNELEKVKKDFIEAWNVVRESSS